jgi:hypothetical protein
MAMRLRSAGLRFFARAVAALLEIADRSSEVKALARALPPSLPSTAAASFSFMATMLLAYRHGCQEKSRHYVPMRIRSGLPWIQADYKVTKVIKETR